MTKTKVLVVSKDPALLNLLQENLGEVTDTRRTDEGLAGVLNKESPDLVILDIMMPEMDGLSTCLHLRQMTEAPIIMLTTWEAGKNRVRGLNLDSDEYLTESFGIEELRLIIKESLQRSSIAFAG